MPADSADIHRLETAILQLERLEELIENHCNDWQKQIFTILESLRSLGVEDPTHR